MNITKSHIQQVASSGHNMPQPEAASAAPIAAPEIVGQQFLSA